MLCYVNLVVLEVYYIIDLVGIGRIDIIGKFSIDFLGNLRWIFNFDRYMLNFL